MMTSPAANGGRLLLHPTPKYHRLPILPSIFLVIPQRLRNSAVPKQLILHPLILCRARRWDSNAETFRAQNFNFNEEAEEDDDDDGEEGFSDFIDEFIDSIWILKVFGSYGWALPPIILSILISSGLKAFLLALSLPVGQSVLTFAFQKLWGMAQNKPRRKNKKRPQSRAPINNNAGRKGRSPSTRNGKSGYRSASRNDQDAPSFGGWDELDERRDFNMEPSRSRQPSVEPSRTPREKGKLNRSGSENGAPLLLRLLIAIFPFLSSWTKML